MKQPGLLFNGEVIWQASDSTLSEELHGVCIGVGVRAMRENDRVCMLI